MELEAPGDDFLIRSVWNDDLALGVVGGKAVMQWLDTTNPAQRWTLRGTQASMRVLNKGFADAPIGVVKVVSGEPVVLNSANSEWMVSIMQSPTPFQLKNSGGMVLGFKNTDIDPGTQAVLAQGKPDDTTQKWVLTLAKDVPTPRTDIVRIGGAQYEVMEDNGRFILQTIVDPQDHRFHFHMTYWSTGFSFQNRASGRFMTYAGDYQILNANPNMSVEALWERVDTSQRDWFNLRNWARKSMYMNGKDWDGAPVRGSNIDAEPPPGKVGAQVWRVSTVPR